MHLQILLFRCLSVWGQKDFLRCLVGFWGLVATVQLTMGQDPELRVPAKDVVVLVDVSGSMAKPGTLGEPITEVGEARDIISGIVTGKGLPEVEGWSPADVSSDEIINKSFSNYFSRDSKVKLPLPPLIMPENSVGVKLVGNFNTVLKNTLQVGKWDYADRRRIPRDKPIGSAEDFPELLMKSWPDTFRDQSTCYTFALARAALRMRSGEGYYIFTVSDEVDDPTYAPISEEGRQDQKMWKEKYEKTSWSVQQIENEISEGMAVLAGAQGKGWKKIKSEQLIARFTKHRTDGGGVININWYYGGDKPKVVPKPDKQAANAPKPDPPKPDPPKPDLKFRLLGTVEGGGTGGSVYNYNYANAMLVYQIDNLTGNPLSVTAKINFEEVHDVSTTQRNTDGAVMTFDLGSMFNPGATGGGLEYGKEYSLELSGTEGLPDKATTFKSTFKFKVDPPSIRWLYWLGAASAALALGIFIYSWRTLRGADQVS
jgi:hypothetical protein